MRRKLLVFFIPVLFLAISSFGQAPVANFTPLTSAACPGTLIAFDGTSSTGGPFTSIVWDFGGVPPNVIPGTITNNLSPTALYNFSGTYTVTLTVTNAFGTNTKTGQVTIYPKPIVDFTSDKTTGCYPLIVNFTDQTVNPGGTSPTAWDWFFPDSTLHQQNPQKKFGLAGSFAITLRVTNNFGCQGDTTKNAYINIPNGINPDFKVDSISSSCKPPTIAYYSSQSTGPGTLSYSWRYGDGSPSPPFSTTPTTSHTYNSSNNYSVWIIVSSNQGCTDSISHPVFIPSSAVNSNFSSPASACVGVPVTFANTSSPTPNSSSWTFGDGSGIIAPSPTHSYASPGNYTVTLINSFSACTDSVSKSITILNPPTANFVALTGTSNCKAPLTVNFQDQSVGEVSSTWDFGDGTIVNNPVPPIQHTYTTLGVYSVTLKITNAGGCTNSKTLPSLVQLVQPSVTITNLPAYGCAPFTYAPTYTVNAVDGVAQFAWNFGNGFTFNGPNPPAQVYGAGKYPVSLTITTNGGCTASFVDTVKVGTTKPTVNFSPAPPMSICRSTAILFQDLSVGADQWHWDFGDGTTSNVEFPPPHKFAGIGPFTVTLTAYDQGCYDSKSQGVYTVNPPLAKFNYVSQCGVYSIQFTDASIGADSWSWTFGNGQVSPRQTPPPQSYPGAGNYPVQLIVHNNASNCYDTLNQTITVGANYDLLPVPAACKGSYIQFSTINYNALTDSLYTFKFGDGSPDTTSRSASPQHQYVNAGVYTVTLIVTRKGGCQDTITKSNWVTINGPTANFNAATTQGCTTLNAQFNDLSAAGVSPIVTRTWDFGDGTIVPNPVAPIQHTYTVQGIYPVKLVLKDAAGCSDSLFRPSYITLSNPIAKFTSLDSNYCPSSKIQFYDSSTGAFNRQYHWDFGNGPGDTSNLQFPPLQTYPAVGQYTVSLKLTDLLTGCTNTYSKVKYINIDTPNANFIMDKNFAACPPLLVNFTFAGHYAKSVLWNFGPGQGVSDSLNTSFLYGFPNIYHPSLTVTSYGGCIVSTSQTVTVNGPTATFNYSPTGGCDSLTVFFNVVSSGVQGYTWIFGYNGDTAHTVNPFTSYFYPRAGIYQPFLKVVDSTNCSVTYPGPTPIIIDSVKARFVMDKNLLCEDGSVNFTDSSFKMTGTKITNFYWDFGDGTVPQQAPSDSLINHFFSVPGLYTVKEVVTTQNGCTDSTFRQVKVVANPVIDIGGDSSQCVPATLHLQGIVLVPDTSALTWKWDFGNGQTLNGPDTASQFYNVAGSYNIQAVAINSSGCTDTAIRTVFMYPLPNVNAGNDTTICLGGTATLTATGGSTYNWIAPAGLACPTCQTIVDQPTVNTTYVVQGITAFGCVAQDTVVVTVNQPVTITVSPDDSLCIGQSRQLIATGASVYNWTPTTGLSNPNIANPMAGPTTTTTYQVIGSDNKFCFFDTGFVKVTVFNYPTINAGPDAVINVGSSYQIGASGSPDIVSLNWLPVTGLSCTTCYSPIATPNSTTTYVATVVNNGNCVTADSIKITVICNNANFFVPNTFSPNGDGVNDVFYVRGKGLNIVPSLTIFNRWGQIVFQKKDFSPNDPSAGWDGTFNGQKAPVDVYVYTLEIICDNSEIIPIHGNVALIR